jgi:hypothetical protein
MAKAKKIKKLALAKKLEKKQTLSKLAIPTDPCGQ